MNPRLTVILITAIAATFLSWSCGKFDAKRDDAGGPVGQKLLDQQDPDENASVRTSAPPREAGSTDVGKPDAKARAQHDCDGINEKSLLNGQDRLALSGDLTLPVVGEQGAIISWRSDNAKIIAPSGKVTAPRQDQSVMLTATCAIEGSSSFQLLMFRVKGVRAE